MNIGRYLRGEDRHIGTSRVKEKDPMDTPLPCHVKVGHVTIRKGVALKVLVARINVLYEMATAKQTIVNEPKSVQVSPLEFMAMIKDKEKFIGRPVVWAEWPSKENK